MKYDTRLVNAVEYLLEKGITKSSEIAKRLNISPYTARNIKKLLREKKENEKKQKKQTKTTTMQSPKKSKKRKTIVEIIKEAKEKS